MGLARSAEFRRYKAVTHGVTSRPFTCVIGQRFFLNRMCVTLIRPLGAERFHQGRPNRRAGLRAQRTSFGQQMELWRLGLGMGWPSRK